MQKIKEQELINADVEVNRAVWAINDELNNKRYSSFKTEAERQRYIRNCCINAINLLKKAIR